VIIFAIVLTLFLNTAQAKETSVYIHGLNANIQSTAYHQFFQNLKSKGPLYSPKLPGHQKINDLPGLNQEQVHLFFQQLLAKISTQSRLNNTIVYAHSMGGILFRNYIPKELRNRFKKIIYLSPGAPPKYYAFFKIFIKILSNSFSIPSYSPKNLRLNNSLPVSSYTFLFKEVDRFRKNKLILPNEEIRIHQNDEVVDVETLKNEFPETKIIKGEREIPYHVYFLE